MIYWRILKSTLEKIYFENIQHSKLLDDEVAQRVEAFMSFFQTLNSGFKVELVLQGKLQNLCRDGILTNCINFTAVKTQKGCIRWFNSVTHVIPNSPCSSANHLQISQYKNFDTLWKFNKTTCFIFMVISKPFLS